MRVVSAGLMILMIGLIALMLKGLHQDPQVLPSAVIGHPLPHLLQKAPRWPRGYMTPKAWNGHRCVALHVFATWCHACQQERAFLETHSFSPIHTISMAYKSPESDLQSWFGKAPRHPVILDSQGELGMELGVYGTPEWFLIDAHGRIQARHVGMMDEPTLIHWQERCR